MPRRGGGGGTDNKPSVVDDVIEEFFIGASSPPFPPRRPQHHFLDESDVLGVQRGLEGRQVYLAVLQHEPEHVNASAFVLVLLLVFPPGTGEGSMCGKRGREQGGGGEHEYERVTEDGNGEW